MDHSAHQTSSHLPEVESPRRVETPEKLLKRAQELLDNGNEGEALKPMEVAEQMNQAITGALKGVNQKDLEGAEVSDEVREMIKKHVCEIPAEVIGRKSAMSGNIFAKNITIGRGGFTMNIPELAIPEGSSSILVGPNGSGKSTLIDTLMGEMSGTEINTHEGHGTFGLRESNNPNRKGKIRIARLSQEEILESIKDMRTMDVIGQTVKHFIGQFPVDDNAWETDEGCEMNLKNQDTQQRISEMSTSLFKLFKMEGFRDTPVKSLSGGERTKLALFITIASDPDVAFFDEPTNHLDLQSIAKLFGIFESYRKKGVSIVNVSHSPWFLEQVGTDSVMRIGMGNQESSFEQHRSSFEKMGKHINISRTGVRKIEWTEKSKGRSASLSKLDNITIPDSPLKNINFPGSTSGSLGRIRLLVGENGTGKTTVLEYYKKHRDLCEGNLAYLPQFWPEELLESDPTIDQFFDYVLYDVNPRCDLETKRIIRNRLFEKLKKTALNGKDRKFSHLSCGEQRLLWFLIVSTIPDIDFLLLDEPTNHMDYKMCEVVAKALGYFASDMGGSMLLSTHDPKLIERLEKRPSNNTCCSLFTKDPDGRARVADFKGKSITQSLTSQMETAKKQGRRVKI